MRAVIKSYAVFASAGYRILALLLLPLLLFSLNLWFENMLMASVGMIWFLLLEVMGDYWLFGGMFAKNAAQMDLFLSSGRGRALLCGAVAGDCARRFLYCLGYGVFYFAIFGDRRWIVAALLVDIIASAVLNVTRHQQTLQLHAWLTGAAAMVYSVLFGVLWSLEDEAAWIAVLLLLLLLLALNVLLVWHMEYCRKRSCYEN